MSQKNCYQLLEDGTTKLHEVIRKKSLSELDEILQTYEVDFDKIKHRMELEFAWNSSNKIWLRKTILVAVTEQQCREAKQFKHGSVLRPSVEQAILVLLINPVDDDAVAVIYPCDTNRIAVFHFIKTLIHNGFLTMDYTGVDGKAPSFVETAASCGNIAAISRLINLGASISLPCRNPLLAACKNLQKDTIEWLLTEHFDSFDCTLRNSSQLNALMILMKQTDVEILDYVLLKMISYRQKYFNESQSQAFNAIFCYEHDVYTKTSIVSSIFSEPIQTKIAEYIVKYQLDLTYQWKGITILADLLYTKLALDYCWNGIRQNPELLGLVVRQETTIVHECIRLRILEILKEMYQLQPQVKRYFETSQAYETLQQALWNEHYDSVEFILENHQQFFESNVDRLRQDVIFCSYHRKTFFVNNQSILTKYFPSLESDIDRMLSKEPIFYPGQDLQVAFNGINLNFREPVNGLDGNLPISTRGSNGTTLLHYAVQKDNLELFTNLLKAGCDFDILDNEGNHAVHYVCSSQIFDILVDKHPDGHSLVHRTNFAGYSVLHKVCQLYTNPEQSILLEKVLSCGANVNQLTNDGKSALFLISNTTALDTIVRHGIQLDVVNNEGQTALERHFMNRNRKMASALLRLTHQLPSFKDHAHKYFAPMIFSNRVFFSQTYQPFLEANPDTLRTLFDAVYENSPERAAQLFNRACCSGPHFVVDNFLKFDYNLNYNFRGEDGSTAIVGLLSSLHRYNDNLVKQLLGKGVDLEIRNKSGRNALLTFVNGFSSTENEGHSTNMIQLLLDCGARLDSQDADGNNALHLAFRSGELELAEDLLRNGADFTAKNNDGKTPVHMGYELYKELFNFIS